MKVEVRDLYFKYDRDILKEITFALDKGSFTALMGMNGSGKSTLLKNMAALLSYHKGCILLNGKEMKEYGKRELAQNLSYIAQNNAPARIKVYDAVLIGRKPYIQYFPTEKDHRIVREVMEYLNLQSFSLKYLDELSGGEVQKVFVARALAQEPEVLLLDEPTSALDLKNQLEVMEIVRKYCQEKEIMTIISIHDINLALRYATNYIFLKDQRIHAHGGIEILNPQLFAEVYAVEVDLYHLNGHSFIIPKKEVTGEGADNGKESR